MLHGLNTFKISDKQQILNIALVLFVAADLNSDLV